MSIELIIAIVALSAVVITAAVIVILKYKKLREDGTQELIVTASDEVSALTNNAAVLSEIESLVLKNSNGQELALNRPDVKRNSEKQYREIAIRGSSAVGQVVQGTMPVLAQAQTLAQIAKVAPNGLFTATGSVGDLMRYGDGTVASFVRKGNQFGKHSGFTEVAIQAANPAAVIGGAMQAMAMISGQYYMNEISNQFKSVDKKLDKLIGYHHDEKIGVLKHANQKLHEITSSTNVDAADIITCQRLAEKCGEVYFEYQTRLDTISIDAKERWFNKAKELQELGENIDDSELNFTIQMCYQASELYEKCKLAEIAVRMKIGNGQDQFIAEKIANLNSDTEMPFHRNIEHYIDKHYAPVIEKVEKISEEKKIPLLSGDTDTASENVRRRRSELIENLADDDVSLTDGLLHSLNEPKEILLLQGESPDSQRVFVLDD